MKSYLNENWPEGENRLLRDDYTAFVLAYHNQEQRRHLITLIDALSEGK